MTWSNGRKLSTIDMGEGQAVNFLYNAGGQRLFKNSNSKSVMYLVVDGVAVGESINNGQTTKLLLYLFDESGNVYGINVNGYDYFFRKNLQGDVVGIWDPETGGQIVTYTYDPWGKLLSMTDTSGVGIGTLNPFRYRSYYYDIETSLYYLNSRYYDPETGRFVSANFRIDDNSGILGANNYCYCSNSPTNSFDSTGEDAVWLQDKNVVAGFGHTGLLIQDSGGKWYHFYWGNAGTGFLGKKGVFPQIKELKNFEYTGISSLNEYLVAQKKGSIYDGAYESGIYFRGDFTASLEYARSVRMNYNVLFNNCLQVSADVLSRGTFSDCDVLYKAALFEVKHHVIPNVGFRIMKSYNNGIVLINACISSAVRAVNKLRKAMCV